MKRRPRGRTALEKCMENHAISRHRVHLCTHLTWMAMQRVATAAALTQQQSIDLDAHVSRE